MAIYINGTKHWFFEKINKTYKPLPNHVSE